MSSLKCIAAHAFFVLLPLCAQAQSKDGTVAEDDIKVMKEVKVKGKRQLMTVKNGVVEFDAQALGMSDDTMLGDLMRLLPGIEISEDGNIFFNGRKVKRLKLNGRNFFRQNKSVMLENLRAMVVDKIRVFDEKPEYAYLYDNIKSKILKGELVIDVVLKKEFQFGLFGNANADGGYSYDGTDKGVYDARLFGAVLTGKSTIGGLASGNNLNRSISMVRNGMFNRMGNDKGQSTSQSSAVNFTHKDAKRNLDFNSTIQMEHSDALLQLYEEEYDAQSFNKWRTNSNKDYRNGKWNVRWDHEQKFKWEKAYLDMKPEIEYTSRRDVELWDYKRYIQYTAMDTGWDVFSLRYGRNQDTRRNASVLRLQNKSNAHFALPFYKSPFEVEWEIRYSNVAKDETVEDAYSGTRELRKDILPSSTLENRVKLRNTLASPKGRYGSCSVDMYYAYAYDMKNGERERHIADNHEETAEDGTVVVEVDGNGREWLVDRQNSYYTTQHSHQHDVGVGLNMKTRNGWLVNADLCGQYSHRSIHDVRMDRENNMSLGDFSAGSNLSVQKDGFRFWYKYKEIRPDMLQMLPVRDAGDRFNLYLGNPNLRNSQEHVLDIGYSKSMQVRQQTVSVGAVVKLWPKAVTLAQGIDPETGVATRMPANVDGCWNAMVTSSYGCRLDKDGKLRLVSSLGFHANRSVRLAYDKGMQDNVRSVVDNFSVNGNARLIYNGIKGMNIYSYANVVHCVLDNRMWNKYSAWTNHSYGINLNYSPRRSVNLSTDVAASVHSMSEHAYMNYTEWVWNASASYSFGKKRAWTLGASAYDILHQIRNRRQEVYEQGYKITRYNTICSYATVKLTYTFDREPGKRKR